MSQGESLICTLLIEALVTGIKRNQEISVPFKSISRDQGDLQAANWASAWLALVSVRIPRRVAPWVCTTSECNPHMRIHHTWFYSQFVYNCMACTATCICTRVCSINLEDHSVYGVPSRRSLCSKDGNTALQQDSRPLREPEKERELLGLSWTVVWRWQSH